MASERPKYDMIEDLRLKYNTLVGLVNEIKADVTARLTRYLYGGALAQGTTTTKFKTSDALIYEIDGVVYSKGATDDIAAPGASTTAAQFRKVLVQIDKDGTFSTKAGAVTTVSQAAAVKPTPDAGNIEVGYIELPNSFTSGTTDVTAGMLKQDKPATVSVSAADAIELDK